MSYVVFQQAFSPVVFSGTSAVSSFSLPSFSVTLHWLTAVAVAIATPSVTVTSVSDTLGGTWTLQAAQTGSGVRTEIWTSPGAGTHSNTVTVHLSGASLASAAAATWEGLVYNNTTTWISAPAVLTTWNFGNTMTATGTGYTTLSSLTIQDSGNLALCAVGYVSPTAFTPVAGIGNIDAQAVPTVASVGVALMDGGTTSATGAGYEISLVLAGSSGNWAQAGVELRTMQGAAALAEYAPASGAITGNSAY